MKPFKRQETFNTVAQHLLTQRVKSQTGLLCRYRSQVDNHTVACAIGCLIKDEFYDPDLEQQEMYNIDVIEAVQKSLDTVLVPDDVSFLAVLQTIHDLKEPNTWFLELSGFAAAHRLEFNVV